MKYSRFSFLVSFLVLFTFQEKVFSQDLSPEQIYEKVNDCVVVILSYDFNNNLSKQGSGVVIITSLQNVKKWKSNITIKLLNIRI